MLSVDYHTTGLGSRNPALPASTAQEKGGTEVMNLPNGKIVPVHLPEDVFQPAAAMACLDGLTLPGWILKLIRKAIAGWPKSDNQGVDQ